MNRHERRLIEKVREAAFQKFKDVQTCTRCGDSTEDMPAVICLYRGSPAKLGTCCSAYADAPLMMDLPVGIEAGDTDWKTADRVYFENHPQRNHMMRLPFDGEKVNLPASCVPAHQKMVVIVRQIETGVRARHGFFWPENLPLCDDEAMLPGLANEAMTKMQEIATSMLLDQNASRH